MKDGCGKIWTSGIQILGIINKYIWDCTVFQFADEISTITDYKKLWGISIKKIHAFLALIISSRTEDRVYCI